MANKKISYPVTVIRKPGFVVEEKTFDSNANVLKLTILVPKNANQEELTIAFNSKFNYDYIFWGDKTYSTTFIFKRDDKNNIIIQNDKPVIETRKEKEEWKYEHTYKIAEDDTKYEIVITNLSTSPLVKENADLAFFINNVTPTPEGQDPYGASLIEINAGNNIIFAEGLFTGVNSLEKVVGLNSVSKECFKNCGELKEVVFDSDLYTLGEGCFNGCVKLPEKLIISRTLVNYGTGALPSSTIIYYEDTQDKCPIKGHTNIRYYTYTSEDRKNPGSYWRYENGKIVDIIVS